jgi:hypothetical protein
MGDVVKLMEERDIEVAMRDGTKLAVDVYRPEAAGNIRSSTPAPCTTRTSKVRTSLTCCRHGEPQDLSGHRASIASLAANNTGSGRGLRPIQPITIGVAG